MKTVTLITGGMHSGKSRYALEFTQNRAAHKTFLATAEVLDEEMRLRIARHQAERAGEYSTLEEPVHLSRAAAVAADKTDLILVDSLNAWLHNLLYRFAGQPELVKREIRSFLGLVGEKRTDMVLVTNEVGLGVVPDNPLTRRFLEELGRLNQELARMSDEVILMISGIPQVIKGASIDAKLDSPF